jgi:hypothetical protein
VNRQYDEQRCELLREGSPTALLPLAEEAATGRNQLSRHFECSVNPKVYFCRPIADTRRKHSLRGYECNGDASLTTGLQFLS